MKIRLIRPYGTKKTGEVLNSVPVDRAKRMVENGIAILVEDKKGHKNVANNKKTKRRANKSN